MANISDKSYINKTIIDFIGKSKNYINDKLRSKKIIKRSHRKGGLHDGYFINIQLKEYKDYDELVRDFVFGELNYFIFLSGNYSAKFLPNKRKRVEIEIEYPSQDLQLEEIEDDPSITMSYAPNNKRYGAYSYSSTEPDYPENVEDRDTFFKSNINFNSDGTLLVNKISQIKIVRPKVEKPFYDSIENSLIYRAQNFIHDFLGNITSNQFFRIYSAIKLINDSDDSDVRVFGDPVGDTSILEKDHFKNMSTEVYSGFIWSSNAGSSIATRNVGIFDVFSDGSITNYTSGVMRFVYRGGVLYRQGANINVLNSSPHNNYFTLSRHKAVYIYRPQQPDNPIFKLIYRKNSNNFSIIQHLYNSAIPIIGSSHNTTNFSGFNFLSFAEASQNIHDTIFTSETLFKYCFNANNTYNGSVTDSNIFNFPHEIVTRINYPGTSFPQVALKNIKDTILGMRDTVEKYPIYFLKTRAKYNTSLQPPGFSRSSVLPLLWSPYRRFAFTGFHPVNRKVTVLGIHPYSLYVISKNIRNFIRLYKNYNFNAKINYEDLSKDKVVWTRFTGHYDYWFFMPNFIFLFKNMFRYYSIMYDRNYNYLAERSSSINETSHSLPFYVYKNFYNENNSYIEGFFTPSNLIKMVLNPIRAVKYDYRSSSTMNNGGSSSVIDDDKLFSLAGLNDFISSYYYTISNYNYNTEDFDLDRLVYFLNNTGTTTNLIKSYYEMFFSNFVKNYNNVNLYPIYPFYPPNITCFNYAPVYTRTYSNYSIKGANPATKISFFQYINNLPGNYTVYYKLYLPATYALGGLVGIVPGFTLDANYPMKILAHEIIYPPTGVLEFTHSLPKILLLHEPTINKDRLVFNQENKVKVGAGANDYDYSNPDFLFTYQYFSMFSPRLWPRPVMYYYSPTTNELNPLYNSYGTVKMSKKKYKVKKIQHMIDKKDKKFFQDVIYFSLLDDIVSNRINRDTTSYAKKVNNLNSDFSAAILLTKSNDKFYLDLYIKCNHTIIEPIIPEVNKEYKKRIDISDYIKNRIKNGDDLLDIFTDIATGKIAKDININSAEILDFPHPVEHGVSLGSAYWELSNLFVSDTKENFFILNSDSIKFLRTLPDSVYDVFASDKHEIVLEHNTEDDNKLFGWAQSLYLKYNNEESFERYLGDTIKINNERFIIDKEPTIRPQIITMGASETKSHVIYNNSDTFQVALMKNALNDPTASYMIFDDDLYRKNIIDTNLLDRLVENRDMERFNQFYVPPSNPTPSEVLTATRDAVLRMNTINRIVFRSLNKRYTIRNMDLDYGTKVNPQNENLFDVNRYYNRNKNIGSNSLRHINYHNNSNIELTQNNLFKLPDSDVGYNVELYSSNKDNFPIILTNSLEKPTDIVFMFYKDDKESSFNENPYSGFHFMNRVSTIASKMYNFDTVSILNKNQYTVPEPMFIYWRVKDEIQNVTENNFKNGNMPQLRLGLLSKSFYMPFISQLNTSIKTPIFSGTNRFVYRNKNSFDNNFVFDIPNIFTYVFMPRIPVVLSTFYFADELRGFKLDKITNMMFMQDYEKLSLNYSVNNYVADNLNIEDNVSPSFTRYNQNVQTFYHHYVNDLLICGIEPEKELSKDLIDRVYGRILFPGANRQYIDIPNYLGINYEENTTNIKPYTLADLGVDIENIVREDNDTIKNIYGIDNSNPYGIDNQDWVNSAVREFSSYSIKNLIHFSNAGLQELGNNLNGFLLYSNFIPPAPIFSSMRVEHSIDKIYDEVLPEKTKDSAMNEFTTFYVNNISKVYNLNNLRKTNYVIYGNPPNGTPLGASKYIQTYYPSILPFLIPNRIMQHTKKNLSYANYYIDKIVCYNNCIPKELMFYKSTILGDIMNSSSLSNNIYNVITPDTLVSETIGAFNIIYRNTNKFYVLSPSPTSISYVFLPFYSSPSFIGIENDLLLFSILYPLTLMHQTRLNKLSIEFNDRINNQKAYFGNIFREPFWQQEYKIILIRELLGVDKFLYFNPHFSTLGIKNTISYFIFHLAENSKLYKLYKDYSVHNLHILYARPASSRANATGPQSGLPNLNIGNLGIGNLLLNIFNSNQNNNSAICEPEIQIDTGYGADTDTSGGVTELIFSINHVFHLGSISSYRNVIRKLPIPFSLLGYETEITDKTEELDINWFYTYSTYSMAKISLDNYLPISTEPSEYYSMLNGRINLSSSVDSVLLNEEFLANYKKVISKNNNNNLDIKLFSEELDEQFALLAEKSKYYTGMPFAGRSLLSNIRELYYMFNQIREYSEKYYPKYKKCRKHIQIFFGKKSRISAGITYLGSNSTHGYPVSAAGSIIGRNYSSFLDKFRGEYAFPYNYFKTNSMHNQNDGIYSINKLHFIGLDARPKLHGLFDNPDENLASYNIKKYNTVSSNNQVTSNFIVKTLINIPSAELFYQQRMYGNLFNATSATNDPDLLNKFGTYFSKETVFLIHINSYTERVREMFRKNYNPNTTGKQNPESILDLYISDYYRYYYKFKDLYDNAVLYKDEIRKYNIKLSEDSDNTAFILDYFIVYRKNSEFYDSTYNTFDIVPIQKNNIGNRNFYYDASKNYNYSDNKQFVSLNNYDSRRCISYVERVLWYHWAEPFPYKLFGSKSLTSSNNVTQNISVARENTSSIVEYYTNIVNYTPPTNIDIYSLDYKNSNFSDVKAFSNVIYGAYANGYSFYTTVSKDVKDVNILQISGLFGSISNLLNVPSTDSTTIKNNIISELNNLNYVKFGNPKYQFYYFSPYLNINIDLDMMTVGPYLNMSNIVMNMFNYVRSDRHVGIDTFISSLNDLFNEWNKSGAAIVSPPQVDPAIRPIYFTPKYGLIRTSTSIRDDYNFIMAINTYLNTVNTTTIFDNITVKYNDFGFLSINNSYLLLVGSVNLLFRIYQYSNELYSLLTIGSNANIKGMRSLSFHKMAPYIFAPVALFYDYENAADRNTRRNSNAEPKVYNFLSNYYSYTTSYFKTVIPYDYFKARSSNTNYNKYSDHYATLPWWFSKRLNTGEFLSYDSTKKTDIIRTNTLENHPALGVHLYEHMYENKTRLTRILSLSNMLDVRRRQAGMPIPEVSKLISHGGFPYYEVNMWDYFACNGFIHEVKVIDGDKEEVRKIGFVLPHPNFILYDAKIKENTFMPEPVYTAPPMYFIAEFKANVDIYKINIDGKLKTSFEKTVQNKDIKIKAHRKHLGFRLLNDNEKEYYWEDLFQNTCVPQTMYPIIQINEEPFDYHTILSHGNTNGGFLAAFYNMKLIGNTNRDVATALVE